MRSSTIRFTGMASGMDTDSIVRDMMRPQQYRIDNQKKQQALLKLKQDAWKDMNKKLIDFHRNFTEKMQRQTTFKQNIITSSNADAISIDAGATMPQGTHTFDVTQLAQSASAVGQGSNGKGLSGNPTVGQLVDGDFTVFNQLSMEVNGKKITVSINENDTLSKVAEAINKELQGKGDNKVATGFTASYDEKNGSFFINSTATGKDQTIKFSSENAEGAKLFRRIGFGTDNPITGKDAEYTYNESVEKFTSASNKIEINGIKATLKAANTGPVTISSEPDTDAIYTWVEDFVKGYNELIDEINLKIGTKPGKDMMPLTAEERESMSDSEIKLWEEKLNNSLFYKDDLLTKFVDSARNILGQLVGADPGKPNSLASIGIVTGTWEEKGKLYIENADEDSGNPNKLRAAIQKDPQGVADLLNTLGTQLYKEHETTLRTSNELKSAMNFYNDKVMTDKMKTFEKQIKTLEERMYKMEDMYYAKFAAMEKMLSTLNNQSSWLAQQFGGY